MPSYGEVCEALGTVHLWIRGDDDDYTADDRQFVYGVLDAVARYLADQGQVSFFEEG